MAAKIAISQKKISQAKADALVVLLDPTCTQVKDSAAVNELEEAVGGLLAYLARVEFRPDKGAAVSVPMLGSAPASQLIIVGLKAADGGDGARFSEAARICAAAATGVRASLAQRPASVAVCIPDGIDVRAVAQGIALGAYQFQKYFTGAVEQPTLKQVQVLSPAVVSAEQKKEFAIGLKIASGVCLTRDLVNEPPNVLTPAELAKRAKVVAKENGLTAKILDAAGIQKAGMNLHYAVGKGSDNLPYFIHLTYKPAKPKGRIVFVGKGITFDSGGLCIKPGPSMPEMKTDMSGAGAVLGLMEAVSALGSNVEVHGIIAAAENMPDARAYRPSDVLTSLSGKGVEVINTDAEGRMVLADALTYAARLSPDLIVDAATLTGATLVALGSPYSAFYTNHASLAAAMTQASSSAGESFWHMPLVEELVGQLKSDITDMKHTGDRFGGAITAALFLREFVEGTPWMHCDIPGPVFRDRPGGMHPKGGTGHAVLTFLQLVEQHGISPICAPKEKKAAPRTRKQAPVRTRRARS